MDASSPAIPPPAPTLPAQPAAEPAFPRLAPRVADAVDVSGPTDEVLVRRLKKGDGEAGTLLVRRYDTMLLGYLRRLAGSDHFAEELHQQAWLSALEHIDRFDPAMAGGFKAWLFRIATNKANDLWRRSGREANAKAGLRLVTDGFEAPRDEADTAEQVERLKEAIAKLPDAQREVVMLRYYTGMKFADIAQLLGCPLNTALGRMHKAMNKLKQMMES